MKKIFTPFKSLLFQIIFFAFIALVVASCGSGTPKQQSDEEVVVEQNPLAMTDEKPQDMSENENPIVEPNDVQPIEACTPNSTEASPETVPSLTKKGAKDKDKEEDRLFAQSGNNTTTSNTPKYTDVSNNKSWNFDAKDEASNAAVETGTDAQVDKYTVILDATKDMKIDKESNMSVWLGIKDLGGAPDTCSSMARKSKDISGDIAGLYFKIVPHAPNFEVYPTESECLKVNPNGTDVSFSVKPKKTGNFDVRADVKFYKDKEGKVQVDSKGSNYLSVKVSVDEEAIKEERRKDLVDGFWSQFKVFWAALIALVFGALLFVIRRFVKKKTGYDSKEDSPIDKIKDTFSKKEE